MSILLPVLILLAWIHILIYINFKQEKWNKHYAINFSKWILSFQCTKNLCLNIHSFMFARLLNVKWCSYISDDVHLSSGLYLIHGPCFLVMGYFTFIPLFLLWLNLNHIPSLCDCHSLSSPSAVKRFSVLITTGCFSTSLADIIKQEFLAFGRPFVPYGWEWVNIYIYIYIH